MPCPAPPSSAPSVPTTPRRSPLVWLLQPRRLAVRGGAGQGSIERVGAERLPVRTAQSTALESSDCIEEAMDETLEWESPELIK